MSLERSLKIAKFYEHIGELGLANEIFKRILRQNAPISAQKKLLTSFSPKLTEALLDRLMLLETGVRYTIKELMGLVRFKYYGIKPLTQKEVFDALENIALAQKFVNDLPDVKNQPPNEMKPIEFRISENIRYLKNSRLRIELVDDNRFVVVGSLVSRSIAKSYKALLYVANYTNESARYCSLPARFKIAEFKALKDTHYKVKRRLLYRLDGDGEYAVAQAIEIPYLFAPSKNAAGFRILYLLQRYKKEKFPALR